MAKHLSIEHLGKCAILTHDYPPANLWTVDGLKELKECLDSLAAHPEVRALVLTGAGEQYFSAGADLRAFHHADPKSAAFVVGAFASAFSSLRAFPGVTVAAINGYALGGGLECALACDFLVAERGSKLGLPETKVGLIPCAGGTKLLTDKVGAAWAKRIILGGEVLSADEAKRIGLVEEVVDPGLAKIVAISLANKVGDQAPNAVIAARRLIEASPHNTIGKHLEQERDAVLQLTGREELEEGISAFFEKRDPGWQEDG